MAEEVPRPERAIPFAIMGTVGIGFVTAWSFSLAMFFSMQDLDALFSTETLVPVLELFRQATRGSYAGAVVLEALVVATAIGCLVASHTWQSRLAWSFARDGGLPGSKWLAHVHPTLNVPLQAHAVSCAIVALLGLLYLGSSTAFYSMVTASIVLLYVSYAIPVSCLLVRGRERLLPPSKRGPFWAGKANLGALCNVVLLLWTLFTLVMYSFPSVMPVTAASMNYVCVVYGILALIMGIDWGFRGRRKYRHRAQGGVAEANGSVIDGREVVDLKEKK